VHRIRYDLAALPLNFWCLDVYAIKGLTRTSSREMKEIYG